jgi:putative resolvase
MNRLISIGELAELKAVSVDTIRRWEKEGKLESVRTDGGHRRF